MASTASAQPKPDMAPIDWRGATAEDRWPLAAAIVDSYGVHVRRCESGLRAVGVQRLNDQEKQACVKALDMGVVGSRYHQAATALGAVDAAKVPPNQVADFNRALDSALDGQRRWLFVREQLLGR